MSPSSLTLSIGTLSPHQARTGKAPSRHALATRTGANGSSFSTCRLIKRYPIAEIADALEQACRVSNLGRETMESINYSEGAYCAERPKGNAMRATGRAHRLPTSAVGLECSDSPIKTREEHHASDLLRRSRPHCSLCRKKRTTSPFYLPLGTCAFRRKLSCRSTKYIEVGKKEFADSRMFCGPVGSGRVRSVCLGPVTLYICGFVFVQGAVL